VNRHQRVILPQSDKRQQMHNGYGLRFSPVEQPTHPEPVEGHSTSSGHS
jgi:hypothetical protein